CRRRERCSLSRSRCLAERRVQEEQRAPPPRDEISMTFTEAAAQVLRLVGRPLHYKEITDLAIEKNLLSHVGKSPEVTMGARLAAQLKKTSKDNPLVRVKPGVFALREWDDATIKAGMNDKTVRAAAVGDAVVEAAPRPTRRSAAAAAPILEALFRRTR